MFTGMLVDLKVHHGRIVHHVPFNYVDGDIHDVLGYDVQLFTMWELKELVQDLGYVNDFKCWYNVGAEHEQVIPLKTDADIVYFLSIIEDYESEVVHLYVEHTVDPTIMINETLLLEYSQTQVGERGGGVDEVQTGGHEHGDGGVDEVHMAVHEHGDGGVDEVQMGDREDGDRVNTNEQIKDFQATPSKSPYVQVKTKAARKLTPSRKKTFTVNLPHCEQPTTSRGGRNYYIISILCIVFDFLKLKMVSELMF